jgi:hypothetical protein
MDAYASHIPLLIRACLATSGPILELGMGDNSTKILIEFCKNRPLISFENDPLWMEKFSHLFKNQWFKPFLVDHQWKNFTPPFCRYGVVFVDLQPSDLRPEIIRKVSGLGDILVAHDSQDIKIDWSIFKYHKLETSWLNLPETAICSNIFDVTKL